VETTTIGGYGTGWGTSVSSPYVAGTTAMVNASGVTDVDRVRQRLREMARDLVPAGWDKEHEYGLLQA
jgi:subtilisin family serine protease